MGNKFYSLKVVGFNMYEHWPQDTKLRLYLNINILSYRTKLKRLPVKGFLTLCLLETLALSSTNSEDPDEMHLVRIYIVQAKIIYQKTKGKS